MSEVKTFKVGPATREKYDAVIRKAAQAVKAAVETKLDCRYTAKKGSYGAYERYLLSNGHTLFFNLESEQATVSEKPSPKTVAKVERAERRKTERAERKAAREAKKAAAVKTVKFDSKLSTLDASNKVTKAAETITVKTKTVKGKPSGNKAAVSEVTHKKGRKAVEEVQAAAQSKQ